MNKLNIFISVCVVLTFLIGTIRFYPGFNINILNWFAYSLIALVGSWEILQDMYKSDDNCVEDVA